MLHKGATRLAGFYLAIIMAISLFFSLNIYQLSMNELQSLRRGGPTFSRLPSQGITTDFVNQLLQERERQYQLAQDHVVARLTLVNLVILVGGGFLSYYLALKTLRPIEEAREAQARFTADASHELRTPITAMRSENEVALMNPNLTLTQAKAQLKSNIEELEKLTELSAGLLRLANGDKTPVQVQEVSPKAFIGAAINRIMPLAEEKQITVHQQVKTDQKILGDENGLTEALVILLDNAVKYSDPKTEVRVEAQSASKVVVIKVIDQGWGIEEKELSRIFDRFHRADTARSKKNAQGYGLGLAIAKNIVDLHSGSLTVTSKPKEGSTFTMRLPVKV